MPHICRVGPHDRSFSRNFVHTRAIALANARLIPSPLVCSSSTDPPGSLEQEILDRRNRDVPACVDANARKIRVRHLYVLAEKFAAASVELAQKDRE